MYSISSADWQTVVAIHNMCDGKQRKLYKINLKTEDNR